ncbi:MAG: LysM peptidoglycan-binding domain-containing protein [Candidatus Omnitrophota bacterium]
MSRRILASLICFIFIISVAGCAVRTYSQRKDRVDQDVAGNAGYLGGTPPAEVKDRSGSKDTRKVYVLEFQSKGSAKEDRKIEQMINETEQGIEDARQDLEAKKHTAERQMRQTEPPTKKKPASKEKQPTGVQNYTVQKGDTLQKISMQFFNTNKKWQKIYDANKDVIKDPNRIKPGMVLRIPLE